jgi:hypothetical protein
MLKIGWSIQKQEMEEDDFALCDGHIAALGRSDPRSLQLVLHCKLNDDFRPYLPFVVVAAMQVRFHPSGPPSAQNFDVIEAIQEK